jgi:outer membrane protein OmpA-like peptidoglycan-associated protein
MRALGLVLLLIACGTSGVVAEESDPAKFMPGRILNLTATIQPLEEARILDLPGFITDFEAVVEDFEIEETPDAIHIDMSANMLFPVRDTDFRPTAHRVLKQVATIIGQQAGPVVIEGYAAIAGDYKEWQLAVQRAAAVKRWLILYGGIAPIRLAAKGMLPQQSRNWTKPSDDSTNVSVLPKGSCIEIVIEKG